MTTPAAEQTQAWRSRIVGEGEESPEALALNPRNWRTHPKGQLEALAGALDEVGWVQRVLVNRRTGLVVDGHARIELARARGEQSVPVLYVDLSEEEEALVLATLDPIAAMAGTNKEALAVLMEHASASTAGLKSLLGSLMPVARAGLTDPDAVPDDPKTVTVKRGELYLLGEHRLMCGDSTNREDVARLLGGATPALMVTDPPYGVGYEPAWRAEAGVNRNRRKLGEVPNDDRADWREAWALSPSEVAYVWHGALHAAEVAESLAASGFAVRSQIIWAKDRFALSRGHYHWQHEPAWYVVRAGSTGGWVGDRSQSTVWQIPAREDAGHGHGTQKPVECMERPLRNHAGDAYDPFLGSGTTLIAAERAQRRCFAMEIEPKYAQVAIERWENFTGQKAKRETKRERRPA